MVKRYGISLADYDQMLADQDFACAICDRAHNDEQGPLYVDHCHATGRVRGLLCRPCNTAIGHFEDNRQRLIQAAAYLERNST
ncbi:endonuclease VII domain-containing protein [Acrocarpospora phusangensis]|uniref:endonuclease VII domain-containing protein n=1 Tax=Acrocarpospora phusangensis TaxID=1070424 RepID=UPI001951829D|nr:endonuclease VII domain-containing protein [Acrocarpospora phusangensis]